MQRRPYVRTRLGPGILYEIKDGHALVEFEYTYLVEIPLKDIDLKGIDLSHLAANAPAPCRGEDMPENGLSCYIMSYMTGFFNFLAKLISKTWARIKPRKNQSH